MEKLVALAAAVLGLIEVLKAWFPNFMKGKEELVGMIAVMCYEVISQGKGIASWDKVGMAGMYSVGAAISAGVLHDKGYNKLMPLVKKVWAKLMAVKNRMLEEKKAEEKK